MCVCLRMLKPSGLYPVFMKSKNLVMCMGAAEVLETEASTISIPV